MQLTTVCKQGVLKGTREGGALAFHDIPYGEHAGRFRPAAKPGPWEGVRDASRPGPVFPQARSRGASREEPVQQEDAFRLNIWTPDLKASLPVFFFIHGGAFVMGGGSLPWYNGAALAATGKAVVVTVNYRLGALGHLYLPGVSEGNLAFGDLLAAFEWVRENIAGFGGDPARITIAGQSAGAWYALALLANEDVASQAEHFCLFSFPGGYRPVAKPAASELGRVLAGLLNAGPDGAGLLSVDADKLVEAQAMAEKEIKRTQIEASFAPVADGVRIGEDIIAEAVRQARSHGKKVLIGTTREETAFFFHARPMDDDEYMAFIRRTSQELFIAPAHRIAALMSDADADVYVYQFNYPSKNPRILACHCWDLPFLFGNFDRWADSPMMAGADLDEARALSRKLQACLLHFLQHGSPDAPDMVSWPRYDSHNRQMMIWNTGPEVAVYQQEAAE